MVDRILVGEGGLRISKPGVDVRTAQQGQYLFDGRDGATIYQCVASGVTQLDPGLASGANRSGSKAVDIDPAFAGYADLFVWSFCYYSDRVTGAFRSFSLDNEIGMSVSIRQVGANVFFNYTTGGTTNALWCRWILFRNSLNG